ncbi:hypothetical protein E3O25_04685 [Cryobacterium sp. TMT1-3]|uniref:Uncharacterized protein n=1 Tax=Cryobacterium luteum TaxID=1424661 RepID=A0A1H8BTS6_9MICO|nr:MULTISPECIES: hypothetical protein [Cryobacterium]TFB89127.1 hypothetical protein E3O10_09545 [Cryobacterium luteum]TFC29535.1 hypothetical protein E3O25_04685 [Cryobacterium sp. TMT1-3]SEM86186.1 hypothetical protein SAMN05216281_102101 [Cryobacterium luteum]
MATRWARFVRGWLTAAVAVLVAALSHVAAGGHAPAPVSIAIALAFAGMVSVALAGKNLSLVRLTLSVGFSQVLFHLLFGLGGSAGSMTVAGHHGAATVIVGAASAAPVSPAMDWMWLAHAVAAVVTIVALRRGERTFWALVELARTALVAVIIALGIVLPTPRSVLVRAARHLTFIPFDLAVLLSPMRHRGPPAAPTAV